jgi:hypothetical protein
VVTPQNWLANHSNTALHATVYRTGCFIREIDNYDWSLDKLPFETPGLEFLDDSKIAVRILSGLANSFPFLASTAPPAAHRR